MQLKITLDLFRPHQLETAHLIERWNFATGRDWLRLPIPHHGWGEVDDGLVDQVVLEQ